MTKELTSIINNKYAIIEKKTQLDVLTIDRRLNEELERKNKKLESVSDIAEMANLDKINLEVERKDFARKNKSTLINDEISNLVYAAPYNLILIAGRVGKGKSTTTANIIAQYIKSRKTVLIISNEEATVDVLDRISCILKEVSFYRYSNGLANDTEIEKISKCRTALVKTNAVRVIDLGYKNNPNYVTSVEGVTALVEEGIKNYDVVILDYYQKVSKSTDFSSKSLNDVQNDLALALDGLKNQAHRGPLIVFSQMWGESNDKKDFESQLKGRKTIFDICTSALEIVANKKEFTTSFHCHKNRWNGSMDGFGVTQGFHKEKCIFVPNYQNNIIFMHEREKWMTERNVGNQYYCVKDKEEE